MEKIATRNNTNIFRLYLSLTKPGIIMGNLLTAAAGFALASKGAFDFYRFLFMIEGLACIIGASCVFNNIIDINLDKKMVRTKKRALPSLLITPKNAFSFGLILALTGTAILAFFTNISALLCALLGLVSYVFIYTFSKYKTRYGTLIGSISGAIPPVVGYISFSNQFDAATLILFLMIVFWQMPHFYAIAIFRMKDYEMGSIPILPLAKGILATKIQIIVYCVAFIFASLFLTLIGVTSSIYLIAIELCGFYWLILSIKGITDKDHEKWARRVFFFSLFIIIIHCLFSILT